MSNYYDRTRLLVAKREDEETPMIIGAYPMTTWEVVPEDDYDRIKREQAERFLGPDWTAYDLIEVIVTIPWQQLAAMYEAREVEPVSVEVAKGDEA